jgi:hypothetical protein
MGVYAGPEISSDGLVLSLDAGNPKSYPGSGTTWTDLSGNGNNGTLTNGPTYDSANYGSIVFDGVDDIVTTTNVFTTLEMWIYDTRSSGNRDILVYNWNGTFGTNSYTFTGTSFETNRNGSFGRVFSGVGQPPLNQWYRFCYRKNGDLYINQTKYTGSGSDHDYTTGMAFGATRGDVSNRLNGRISNIRLYNRTLSEEEISQNFNATRGRFGI